MRLTTAQLRKIISEEVRKSVLREVDAQTTGNRQSAEVSDTADRLEAIFGDLLEVGRQAIGDAQEDSTLQGAVFQIDKALSELAIAVLDFGESVGKSTTAVQDAKDFSDEVEEELPEF